MTKYLNLKVTEEGNTTTSANVLFDILRKIPAGTEINFSLKSENKLSLNQKIPILTYYVYLPVIFQLLMINLKIEKIELDKKIFCPC